MTLIDRATILKFHKDRILKHGVSSSKAAGWRKDLDRVQRFKVLSSIGDLNNKSVFDVGCGHGHLSQYLRDIYSEIDYTGIDQEEAFIKWADLKYGDFPNTRFWLGDFWNSKLPLFDVVLACGSLNYRNSDDLFINRIIIRLFQLSNLAFGFNLLKKVDYPGGILKAYDPEYIAIFCKQLSDHVILKDEYSSEEFTIYMYKDDSKDSLLKIKNGQQA